MAPPPDQTAGDPFTVGRGLEQDPRPGPPAEHRGEALRLGADPLLDELTTLSENANLSFPLVDVDANMVHGRPLLSAALTACCSRGAVYATTSSERRAASSDLSSALPVEGGAAAVPRRDLAAAFEAQAARVGDIVHRTPRDGAAAHAAQIFREAACRTVALADAVPERSVLAQALGEAGLSLVPARDLRPTRRADGGISWAKLGVAETGSTLLHSTSEDRRVELCVDVHLVLLAGGALVPTLDAAFAALRAIGARPPAYASLVSGPSRSADIERQLTIGVHGPRALHVLLLEDGS